MPARTLSMMTDADVGLSHDPIAQERAEEFIRSAVAFRLHAEAKAKSAAAIQTVEVPLEDLSISISDVPTDLLDGISAELRRIASRPVTA